MDKEKPSRPHLRLVAELAGDDNDSDDYDLDPEVKSYDNNQHYYVVFRLKGKGVALEPDDARDFAESLLAAADEADAKLT